MQTYQSVLTLADALRSKPVDCSHVIGIDGFMLSGKTTLAFELADALSGIRVGLDSYLNPSSNPENYCDMLKVNYLANDLNKLMRVFPFVIVDGICLLDVLDTISCPVHSTVYVKRISAQGIWDDGFNLEDFEAGEIPQGGHRLAKCELAYHSNRCPHDNAQFLYQRVAV